jgi:hypothetical protein
MIDAVELAGVVQNHKSEHKKFSQGHGEVEGRTAISPRGSIRPEEEQKRPGARRGGGKCRRDPNAAYKAVRARLRRLKSKRRISRKSHGFIGIRWRVHGKKS